MTPGPRYVPKPRGNGTWGVYDREQASWPVLRPGVGRVRQVFTTEADAQAEADRLDGAT